jgi:hypothetical protein
VQAGTAKTLSQTGVWYLTWSSDAVFGPTQGQIGERGESIFQNGSGYGALDLDGLPHGRGGTAYLLFVPGTLYVSPAPTSSLSLPKGKSVVAVSLDDATDRAFPGFVEQAQALDPRFLLDELAWGATAATDHGGQVILHRPLTRYTVSVDLARAAAKADSAAARIAIRAERAALGAHASPVIRMTVWLEGTGHVARVQAPVPGSGFGRVLVSIDGFGQPIKSTHPTPSELVPLTQLAPALPPGRSPFVALAVRS